MNLPYSLYSHVWYNTAWFHFESNYFGYFSDVLELYCTCCKTFSFFYASLVMSLQYR